MRSIINRNDKFYSELNNNIEELKKLFVRIVQDKGNDKEEDNGKDFDST